MPLVKEMRMNEVCMVRNLTVLSSSVGVNSGPNPHCATAFISKVLVKDASRVPSSAHILFIVGSASTTVEPNSIPFCLVILKQDLPNSGSQVYSEGQSGERAMQKYGMRRFGSSQGPDFHLYLEKM